MKTLSAKEIFFLMLAISLMMASPGLSNDKPFKVGMDSGEATVTFLHGTAVVLKDGKGSQRIISLGDKLVKGDEIRTGKSSRVELKLPDGSIVRFDEDTIFVLHSVSHSRVKKFRRMLIKMLHGKIWSSVSKRYGGESRFEIHTDNAVAGVRGTIYRLSVRQDRSVTVKVYGGKVVVDRIIRPFPVTIKAAPSKVPGPHPVEGPSKIPGPHKVSLERWTYIVKSMEKINISPEGVATSPEPFTLDEDASDWVRWNLGRDGK